MQRSGNGDRRLFRRLAHLTAGLILYGTSIAIMVKSSLGLNPWDVFHQGLARVTGISFGLVVLLVGIPVLALWIPLRQRPGPGTVANLLVVGFAADGALAVLPPAVTLPDRVGYLTAGILLNGLATGLYLGSRLGPGPRDGLMTGVVARFPRLSVRLVRTVLELTVLGAGVLLGGTAGVGTVAYALAIGPLVQLFLPLCTVAAVPRPEPDSSAMDSAVCRSYRDTSGH